MPFAFPSRLYPLIDDGDPGCDPVERCATLLAAGVELLQLRIKRGGSCQFTALARAVAARCKRSGAQLIINDRADIARLVGAAGVHLGQGDLAPADARRILGTEAVIGYSTHNRAQLERGACDEAVDYLAFGPIFPTTSKRNPDPALGLRELASAVRLCPKPLVAIGGVTAHSLADILATGASAAAVIGAISRAGDPAGATRELLAIAAGTPTVPPTGD